MMTNLLRFALAACVCALVCSAPPSAYADDYVIYTCTEAELNRAIDAANDPDNPQGTITFACSGSNVITVTAPKLIRGRVTINGDNRVILSGGDTSQLFLVASDASLVLRNITLDQGRGGANFGGAINVSQNGFLAVIGSTIKRSIVNTNRSGGAIYSNRGSVFIESSELRNNTGGYGGAVAVDGGTLTISDTLIIENQASFGDGGGVQAWFATTTLTTAQIENNFSNTSGGGISLRGGKAAITGGSSISNTASQSGAGVYLWGGGALTIEAYALTNNRANLEGGGIYNSDGQLTLAHSVLQKNTARSGGGLTNAGGTLQLRDTLLFANTGTNTGGGLDNVGGTTSVERTLFLQNNVLNNFGGGIYTTVDLVLTNVVLQANKARVGGGLAALTNPTTLVNVTIKDNVATERGGGVFSNSGANTNFTARNSVFARNTPQSCFGTMRSIGAGYNIVDDISCSGALTGTADNHDLTITFADVPFSVLGSTLQVPQLSAVGLDSIPTTNCPPTDIRGVARPQGDACDAGAIEAVVAPPVGAPSPTPIANPSSTPVGAPSPTPIANPSSTPVGAPSPTPVSAPSPTPVGAPSTTPIANPSSTHRMYLPLMQR